MPEAIILNSFMLNRWSNFLTILSTEKRSNKSKMVVFVTYCKEQCTAFTPSLLSAALFWLLFS